MTADEAGAEVRPAERRLPAGAPRRIDVLLVERGLFESRARARAAIEAGLVAVAGVPVAKASTCVPVDVSLVAEAPHPWVSRGGVKLDAALRAFAIDPAGRVCLDVGASTGGFTHVLLARGARRIYALDVGHAQLHPKLAAEPRIVSREGSDARELAQMPLPEPVSLVVVDVSFISVKLLLPAIAGAMDRAGDLVVLVKPQFEAGRGKVGRGGIVRDAAIRDAVAADIREAVGAQGFEVTGLVPSPIHGGDGNHEYLLGARRG